MYGCQQHLVKTNPEIMAILEYLCTEANKLTNCGIYYCRQMLFKAGGFLYKVTTWLAKNHSTIVIEDLNVSGMLKNHGSSKRNSRLWLL